MSSANALVVRTVGMSRVDPHSSGMVIPRIPSGSAESQLISEMRPCMQIRYKQGDSGQPCANPFVVRYPLYPLYHLL